MRTKRTDWRKLPKNKVHVLNLTVVTREGNRISVMDAHNVTDETAELAMKLFDRLAQDL